MPKIEHQESVAAWCSEHYPGESRLQLLRNMAEELSELAVELGEDPEELVHAIRASASREASPDGSGAGGEVADLQISLWALAEEIGVDAQEETDRKMAEELRPRDPEESRARQARKAGAGLRTESGWPSP